jgi:hypothetical protein
MGLAADSALDGLGAHQTAFPLSPHLLTEERMMDKAYTLLGVLLEYAPHGTAQTIMTNTYHKMKADPYMREADIEVELAAAILDGLRYGNWPWTLTELAKQTKEKE